jgi:hypothetical protein
MPPRRYSDQEIREIEASWDNLVSWLYTVRGRLGKRGIESFRRMYDIPSDSDLDAWADNRSWGLIQSYAEARGVSMEAAKDILNDRPYLDILKSWKKDFV